MSQGEEGLEKRRAEVEGRRGEGPWKEEWNVVHSGFRVFGGEGSNDDDRGGTMRDGWEPFSSGFKIF